MEIENISGPGFDSWFMDRLRRQGISTATSVQKLAIETGICANESMLICAPTSSGKTLVAELAMLATFRAAGKAIYLVSHKALADQKYEEFTFKYGRNGNDPIASVAISTGDRDEGDADPYILVTTYEKAIALVMSGAVNVSETTIIADELQIIGEDKRGPEIEVLCAALIQRKPKKFVALTATIGNGNDIAAWLNCKIIQTYNRDISLIQEIWYDSKIYATEFGQETGSEIHVPNLPTDTISAVEFLLLQNKGPILVFTETRREAMDLADKFSARRTKTPAGYKMAEQFELFSEATEFSEKLKSSTETKVAFHTADLTSSERLVIEQGLVARDFDVCFATPTLAAGVNFPFRTVVFDRIIRRFIPPPELPRGAYRNMSGRAGRLGMHDNGYSIIIPRDRIELSHAQTLIQPENDPLNSKLSTLSIRKIVLILISSGYQSTENRIKEFLESTLFWHQVRDRNPKKIEDLLIKIIEAISWLEENQLVHRDQDKLYPTELGAAAARTGLLPTTVIQVASALSQNKDVLAADFDSHEIGLIHLTAMSDEFSSDSGQRFLPNVANNIPSHEADGLIRSCTLLVRPDFTSFFKKNNQAVLASFLFMSGEAERRIAPRTGIPSGQIHRMASDISWVIDGMQKIAAVKSVGCSQVVMNKLSLLSRKISFGAPTEIIDVIKVAQKGRVPGFGRQRALSLLKARIVTQEDILNTAPDILEKLLSSKERATSLLQAIENQPTNPYEKSQRRHIRVATSIGIQNIIEQCYLALGNDYEDAIERLLRESTPWEITKLDDGKRQGVPDFMITNSGNTLVLECKTCTKKPPHINKEEAFAVLIKAADIKDAHKITLGKPGFETFAEGKACASTELTLLRHSDLIEAVLLIRLGVVTHEDAFQWLLEPGVAEIERLGILPI